MELIVLFLISFMASVVLAYAGIACQKKAEQISDKDVLAALMRWLYLFPLFDLGERIASNLFPNKSRDNILNTSRDWFTRAANAFVSMLFVIVLVSAVLWLFWFVFLNYISEVLIGVFVLVVLYNIVGRR